MTKYSHKYNIILDNMDLTEYRLKPISAIMYIQDTFARYCGAKRVAAYDLFKENLIWVVGEFNIEFVDKMPFWSEEFGVNIWISEITKLKIYADYELCYKDKVFAKGNSCWFLLDDKTKRPVRTDIVTDRFEICEELAIGEHKKFKLKDTVQLVSEIKHKNNFSDIDFNDHVNNKSYLNIAEATASKEFKQSHVLKALNIRFNKESFLGDVLDCTTYNTDEENIYVHRITKEDENICDIQTEWNNREMSEETIVKYDLELNRGYK